MLTDNRPELGYSRIGRGLDASTYRDFQSNFGLSRTAIFNQVEASLRRLQMDYIDVLQLHRLDRSVDKEEVNYVDKNSVILRCDKFKFVDNDCDS